MAGHGADQRQRALAQLARLGRWVLHEPLLQPAERPADAWFVYAAWGQPVRLPYCTVLEAVQADAVSQLPGGDDDRDLLLQPALARWLHATASRLDVDLLPWRIQATPRQRGGEPVLRFAAAGRTIKLSPVEAAALHHLGGWGHLPGWTPRWETVLDDVLVEWLHAVAPHELH